VVNLDLGFTVVSFDDRLYFCLKAHILMGSSLKHSFYVFKVISHSHVMVNCTKFTHISVLGVGCTKNHADNWIAQQDDFNSLLTSLNADVENSTENSTKETCVQQLELKSKSSKSRLQ